MLVLFFVFIFLKKSGVFRSFLDLFISENFLKTSANSVFLFKIIYPFEGGDPSPPSSRLTLLRLHFNQESHFS